MYRILLWFCKVFEFAHRIYSFCLWIWLEIMFIFMLVYASSVAQIRVHCSTLNLLNETLYQNIWKIIKSYWPLLCSKQPVFFKKQNIYTLFLSQKKLLQKILHEVFFMGNCNTTPSIEYNPNGSWYYCERPTVKLSTVISKQKNTATSQMMLYFGFELHFHGRVYSTHSAVDKNALVSLHGGSRHPDEQKIFFFRVSGPKKSAACQSKLEHHLALQLDIEKLPYIYFFPGFESVKFEIFWWRLTEKTASSKSWGPK